MAGDTEMANKIDYSASTKGIEHTVAFFSQMETDFVCPADLTNDPRTKRSVTVSYTDQDGKLQSFTEVVQFKGEFYGDPINAYLPSAGSVFALDLDQPFGFQLEISAPAFPDIRNYVKSSYASLQAYDNAVDAYFDACNDWYATVDSLSITDFTFKGLAGEHGTFELDIPASWGSASALSAIPERDDHITGSNLNDTIEGHGGDDLIKGGKGDDTIDAGETAGVPLDRDTMWFEAAFVADNYTRFLEAKAEAENRDNDATIIVKTALDGQDTITNAELGKFGTAIHHLEKIFINIVRTDDGRASGEVFINGERHDDLSAFLEGGKMRYDTLTPIDSGDYAAYFRLRPTAPKQVLEMEDWSGNQATILQTDDSGPIERTNIQLHGGNANGQSEGCFLANGFNPALWNYVAAMAPAFSVGTNFYPVVPISIQVSGEVSQPTVEGVADRTSDRTSHKSSVSFTLANNAVPIEQKKIDVFFKVATAGKSDAATEGVDWAFLQANELNAGQVAAQFVGLLNGTGERVYKARMDVDSAGNLVEDLNIGVRIFGDAAGAAAEGVERIRLTIVDLDIFTRKSNGDYVEYKSSLDSDTTGNFSLRKAELLLVGATQTRTSTLTINKDPVATSVADLQGLNDAAPWTVDDDFWVS